MKMEYIIHSGINYIVARMKTEISRIAEVKLFNSLEGMSIYIFITPLQ